MKLAIFVTSDLDSINSTQPTGKSNIVELGRGDYGQLSVLQKVVADTFSEFERIFEDLGFDLYDDNVDPNQPAKKFVE